MPELESVEKVKVAGFVSPRKTKNQERIEKDEKELEELLKTSEGTGEVSSEGRRVSDDNKGNEGSEQEEALPKEEVSFKKRYGDLRRHMADKDKQNDDRIKALEDQLSKATKNELVLPKTEEEIAAWTKKYPDVAGIVETIADKKARERSSDLDKRMQDIEKIRVDAVKEKAEAELIKIHPDFMDIREDDSFHDWADKQPKWVQDALYENTDDAKSVARVIDLYKIDSGISSKKSDNGKRAASAVNTKSRAEPTQEEKGVWKESQVEKMSDKDDEKHAESIQDSIQTGKFVYDISGAAR